MAVLRERIQPGRPELFWDQLAILPIDVEPPLSSEEAKAVLAVCQRHGLTVYDALYLELAMRKDWPLATLDSELIKAALQEGARLVVQSS